MPGNLHDFTFPAKGLIHGFCRWWHLAWKSTRVGACDVRVVDGVAGQVGPKAVQDFPSAFDRVARSCALGAHRMDRTGAMQNPSASGTAGLRDCAARSGIGVDRDDAMQDPTSSAPRARRPSARIEHRDGRITAMQNPSGSGATRPRAGTRPERSSDSSLRGWVLSSVGQAKPDQGPAGRSSGAMQDRASTRAVRRLTSRQVPDCLRGPAEERAHPRHPTTPNPSPPHQSQHPHRPRHSLREKGPRRRRDLETPARPANATGGQGGQAKLRAARSGRPHPTGQLHATKTQPIIKSL